MGTPADAIKNAIAYLTEQRRRRRGIAIAFPQVTRFSRRRADEQDEGAPSR
jgi:small-conductance mechanosensitive channel